MAADNRRYLTPEELGQSVPRKTPGAPTPPSQVTVGPASPRKLGDTLTVDENLDQLVKNMRKNATPVYLPENPLSDAATNYLSATLPERLDSLSPAARQEQAQALMDGASYNLGSFLDRGAESVLYNATINGFTFCVKSIRNWKDRWFGDPRYKGNQGKLASVSYKTKYKHLSNEFKVGQLLNNASVATLGTQIPVSIFSLRKVSSVALELGWDLLMERINGIDLGTKPLQNALSLEDKVRVCLQICKAIGQFHQRNLIHLDIKPSNFMMERSGRIRLIDFGISVPTGFQKKTIAGTAGFMSPEQICRAELGMDTDIFALGVTFSLLFGAKPLNQDPNDAVQKDFRHSAARDMEKNEMTAVGEIPELTGNAYRELADVIRNCTVYRRDRRIPSCTLLAKQLQNAAENCGLNI